MAHNTEPDFVAENFFKFHPDAQISSLAVDLIADKYQLSRIFSRQNISENVVLDIGVQSDANHLTDIVPQLLLELKYTIINIRIDQMTERMKTAQETDDWELLRELLTIQPTLLDIKNQISRQLGNRIITP
jgi:DNA primase